MKFKNDKHRKAVFANMFGGEKSRVTKVNFGNIKNLEIRSKTSKNVYKPSYSNRIMKGQKLSLKDIEKVSSESEYCKSCKRKNLPLDSGECKECEKENQIFKEEEEERKKKLRREREKIVETALKSVRKQDFNESFLENGMWKDDVIINGILYQFASGFNDDLKSEEPKLKRISEIGKEDTSTYILVNAPGEGFDYKYSDLKGVKGSQALYYDGSKSYTPSSDEKVWPKITTSQGLSTAGNMENWIYKFRSVVDAKDAKGYSGGHFYTVTTPFRSPRELKGKGYDNKVKRGNYSIYELIGRARRPNEEQDYKRQYNLIKDNPFVSIRRDIKNGVAAGSNHVIGNFRENVKLKDGKKYKFYGVYDDKERLERGKSRLQKNNFEFKTITTIDPYTNPGMNDYWSIDKAGKYALFKKLN